MGFRISVTTRIGDTYKSAYFKVGNVHFDPDSKRCRFKLVGWKDQKHRKEGAAQLRSVEQDGKRISLDFSVRNRPAKSEKVDKVFDDNFSISEQNKEGMNISKLSYLYIQKQFKAAGIEFTNVDPD